MNRYMEFPLPIYTPRLQLRAPIAHSLQDARLYHQAVRNSLPEIRPWLGWVTDDYSLEDAQRYTQVSTRSWKERNDSNIGLVFWVMDRTNQHFISNLVIWNMDWRLPKFELGFWIDTQYSGQGMMREAVIAMTSYCLALGVVRVEIRCEMANQRMHRLMQATQFHLDGVLPQATRAVSNGKPADVAVYSCTDAAMLPALEVSWPGK